MASIRNFVTKKDNLSPESRTVDSGLDPVAQAENILRLNDENKPKKIGRKMLKTLVKVTGGQINEEEIAAKSLLGAVQATAHQALKNKVEYDTCLYGANLIFTKTTEDGAVYGVRGLYGDTAQPLPSDFTIESKVTPDSSESPSILPSEWTLSEGKSGSVLSVQSPSLSDEAERIETMNRMTADFLEHLEPRT